MPNYIEVLKNNLSCEDKKLLKKIYEPTIVCYPADCACTNICITDDGEIRYYSVDDKLEYADNKQRIYFASKDCGLSWKKYIVEDDDIMGHAYKSAYSGRYFDLRSYNDREKNGFYVCFSNGYDDVVTKCVRIGDYMPAYDVANLHHPRIYPIALKGKKRYVAVGEGRIESEFSSTFVMYSDDDCETWTFVVPEIVPNIDVESPHKGARWHNSCEPTLIEKNDGTLMMIVRTSQNYHYAYYSYDFGETWTKPEPTIFHSTLTMPTLYRLHDNRLMFFWCNTQPLPELDHSKQMPPLDSGEQDGTWEDLFTNRDANHVAISEDDGESWIGFREMMLNPVRNNSDFRAAGGGYRIKDKSVHQIEAIELPYNKMLVFAGQHEYCTRGFIFDIDWLYEKNRKEDFTHGLINMSTQVYLKSISGNFKSFSGHCAWNRTNGAVVMPDPDYKDREEVLFLSVTDDERLYSNTQGAVWNFPTVKKGSVKIKLRVCGSGLRISLTDRWINPVDAEIQNDAYVTYIATSDIAPNDKWTLLEVKWNTESGDCIIKCDDAVVASLKSKVAAPYGICYLHLQTVGKEPDVKGVYIKSLDMKAN